MGIVLYHVLSLYMVSFGSKPFITYGNVSLKWHSTTVSVKSLAVSCYMPDLLREIMHMAAHGQGYKGYNG